MTNVGKELGLSKGFDASQKYGWFVNVRGEDGKWKKRYSKTEKERDDAFRLLVKEVALVGVEAATDLTVKERLSMVEMRRLAQPTGLTPMEIFERGLAQVGGHIRRRITVEDAYALFDSDQKMRKDDGKISQRTYDDARNRITKLVSVYGKRQLGDVDRAAMKLFIGKLGVAPQTRLNYSRNISAFFAWCVDEGYLWNNPVPAQEGVDRIPVIFPLDEVKRVFRMAVEQFSHLVPMLAVQWFAGLRPGASQHLTWPDVDFARKRIIIQPHGNKLRQPDIVQDVPDAVFEWLAPFRQEAGLVTPKEKQYSQQAFHHALGYSEKESDKDRGRWPPDVSRHTFASNLVAVYDQDLKRVSNAMLHSTTRMLLKHYLVKNISKEAGESYFALRPSSL